MMSGMSGIEFARFTPFHGYLSESVFYRETQ